jgi:hypothetical protein
MSDDILSFDINEGHVYFSARAFNRAWEYIEQGDHRSPEEDLMMLNTAIASLWHWSQREDVKAENLSVGYWQVSRVFNLLKQPDNARTYGLQALKYAEELEPFFKAYAYETLARSEMLANNRIVMMFYLEKAREMTSLVAEEEDRQLLLKDLESIQ